MSKEKPMRRKLCKRHSLVHVYKQREREREREGSLYRGNNNVVRVIILYLLCLYSSDQSTKGKGEGLLVSEIGQGNASSILPYTIYLVTNVRSSSATRRDYGDHIESHDNDDTRRLRPIQLFTTFAFFLLPSAACVS